MKEKIFPVSSYAAINDEEGDIVVKTLPLPHQHQQLPRRQSEARSVRKGRREEAEADNPHDKNEPPIRKSEEEEESGGEGQGMAVLPVAGQVFQIHSNYF